MQSLKNQRILEENLSALHKERGSQRNRERLSSQNSLKYKY